IQMAVKTQGTADLAKFREGLDSLGLCEITLQSFGDKSSILVRAQRQEGVEEAQTAAVTKLNAEDHRDREAGDRAAAPDR
ncbi:hypothetical protein, partial [Rhizobium leguminosarum]|uniref:hypothetical protein n=1 Tax=Rhizobium leguminosarum TaxID=384 RepID=UPI003F9E255F